MKIDQTPSCAVPEWVQRELDAADEIAQEQESVRAPRSFGLYGHRKPVGYAGIYTATFHYADGVPPASLPDVSHALAFRIVKAMQDRFADVLERAVVNFQCSRCGGFGPASEAVPHGCAGA